MDSESEITLTGYNLSRDWFDFAFENPDLIKPVHAALYFFIIEHNNRLGWRDKFGLPTPMTMDAIGVKNWRTYKAAFDDLVKWKFVKVHELSKNQYSATVIGLVKNTKANTKALTKAIQKHLQKQSKSIVDIDKLLNILTNKPINDVVEILESLFDSEKQKELPPRADANAMHVHRGCKASEMLSKVKDIKEKESKINIPQGFDDIIILWFEYKIERKQMYKLTGAKTFIKQLIKFSSGNPEKALEIVENSMANNWAGIFELKQSDKPTEPKITPMYR